MPRLCPHFQRSCPPEEGCSSAHEPPGCCVGCGGRIQQVDHEGLGLIKMYCTRKVFNMFFRNLVWFSKWKNHQPWELASERWSASPNIQPHAMSSGASGHHWSNVWTHEAWNCRLVCVAKILFNLNLHENMFPIHLAHCSLQTLSAMCIENLEGDYYIPGSQPDGAEGIWKEAQARFGFHFEKTLSPYIPLLSIVGFSIVRRQQMKLSCYGPSGCSLTTTAKPPRVQVRSKRHLGCWN